MLHIATLLCADESGANWSPKGMLLESVYVYAGLFLAAFASFVLYGATAFGFAIVYQLSFQLLALAGVASGEVSDAVQEIYMCILPACGAQVVFLWKHLHLRFLVVMTILPMLTQPLGLYLLFFLEEISAASLKRGLGACFVVTAIAQCYIEVSQSGSRDACNFDMLSRRGLFALSMSVLVEGFLMGLFNTSGLPIMIFLFYQPMEMMEFRAVAAASQVLLSVQGTWVISERGDAMVFAWEKRVVLSAGALLGLSVGNLIAPHISAAQFRQTLVWLLFVGGASLISCGNGEMQVMTAIFGVVYAIIVCGSMVISEAMIAHKTVPEGVEENLLSKTYR